MTEVVPTHAERLVQAERKRAREEAEGSIDWERRLDADRAPGLTYVDGGGCARSLVFGWSNDRAEAITIRADWERLDFLAGRRTLDLTEQGHGIEVAVHVFDRPMRRLFCSDIGVRDPPRQESWQAVAGTLTVEFSPLRTRAGVPELYHARIVIDGAELASPAGVRMRVSQPISLSAEPDIFFR